MNTHRDEVVGSLVVSLALVPADARRYEWLTGWDEHEHEELETWIRHIQFCRPSALRACPLAQRWVERFPELLNLDLANDQATWTALWALVLHDVRILRVAYAFNRLRDFEQTRANGERVRALQMEMTEHGTRSEAAAGRLIFTESFPLGGPPTVAIEARAGLEAAVKRRLGLGEIGAGILLPYLAARKLPLEDFFTPRQFEQLCAAVLREEGWDAEVTQESRDGGKDIIARREENGAPVTIYVQAKKNRADRTVGLPEVKEFAATLAGDGVARGILVATSRISQPARDWLSGKGAALATVDLVPGDDLERWIARVAVGKGGVYSFGPGST